MNTPAPHNELLTLRDAALERLDEIAVHNETSRLAMQQGGVVVIEHKPPSEKGNATWKFVLNPGEEAKFVILSFTTFAGEYDELASRLMSNLHSAASYRNFSRSQYPHRHKWKSGHPIEAGEVPDLLNLLPV
jgi:hypothetical protein